MKNRVGSMCILGVLLLLASCNKTDLASSLYVPTQDDVTANATLDELKQGRELYINNCGKCHGLYSPDDFSASQWHSILSGMAPRTNLSSSEVSLVSKYVTHGK